MKYCARCLYPANHPYGIVFDEQGVCSGCRVHEEKDYLDWGPRAKILGGILDRYKTKAGHNFDCIIPVTGGGDSYFIVHVVKNVYGLNPLLVSYNHEYNTKRGIRNLGNLVSALDCDLVQYTLSPEQLQKITRQTLRKYGNMYWHVLAGYLTFPVQVAVKFKIPLIVWGVHPFSDQVGMFSHLDEVEMTEKTRKEHGLFGVSAEHLVDGKGDVSRRDVQPFIYPYDNELERIGVRGIYLSNYIRWDSKAQHELMIDLYGYESAEQQRTFNTYEDVHCFHSAGIHDYLKFLRYGYGKVTDHASREIRLRRMTREEGARMVERYSARKPSDLPLFLKWVGMTDEEFNACVWDRREPAIWEKLPDGEYRLRDSVLNHIDGPEVDAARLEKREDCEFRITPQAEDTAVDSYLLMGRGYIDRLNYAAIEDRVPGGGMTPRLKPIPWPR